MAKRRKGRGRPRKKKITYDSKEFKFVIGLLSMAMAILAFMSYVLPGDEGIFRILRSAFGEATFLFSAFLFNLALYLFGARYIFSSLKSVIGQIILTFMVAIYIASVADSRILEQLSYAGSYGGIWGYNISQFSEEFFLLNLTAPTALIIIVFMLPVIMNQGLAEFFTNLFSAIKQAYDFVILGKSPQKKRSEKSSSKDNTDESKAIEPKDGNPSMFSHFRKLNNVNDSNAANESTENEGQQKKPLLEKKKIIEEKPDPEFVGISSHAKKKDQNNLASSQKSTGYIEGELTKASDDAPKLQFPNWKLPPSELLNEIPNIKVKQQDVKSNSMIIEQTLQSFGIESKVMNIMIGPSVTQYALDIALGIKVSKIANLKNDLALALATSANAVRIEVPIPGTSYVGIEIPNSQRTPVFFRELVEDKGMDNLKLKLPVSVGKDITGAGVVGDIKKMPHLLIAGATGSGKSVLTNSFIMSLLMKRTPDDVRLILVDPKQVELSDYDGIPHLLTPVIVDMDKVLNALKWAVAEMEERYTKFRDEKVRNIEGYNEKFGFSALPYIVIVIDEMADMMLTANKVEVETQIVRLAQKARATGIHLILATQRPSVNVITGIIKANIPGRIGMSVTTNQDSRVILDQGGAEYLLGKGDMLYKEPDKNKAARVQGVFVGQDEVQRVVKYIKDQAGEMANNYVDEVTVEKNTDSANGGSASGSISGDTLFEKAVHIIVSEQKGSASMLQRKLSVGYNRAAKLIDEMAELGIVGAPNGSKPRDVLITDADTFLASLKEE